MKEIKFLILILTIAGYTSLFWLSILTDWLIVQNGIDIGRLFTVLGAIVILIISFLYIVKHWDDDKKGK